MRRGVGDLIAPYYQDIPTVPRPGREGREGTDARYKRTCTIPADISAWTAIVTPSTVMMAADVRGSQRLTMGPSPCTRVMKRRA
jgi:hypothetical protein